MSLTSLPRSGGSWNFEGGGRQCITPLPFSLSQRHIMDNTRLHGKKRLTEKQLWGANRGEGRRRYLLWIRHCYQPRTVRAPNKTCAEQNSQNRPPGTEVVPCQTADASTTLAASSTQNWLQAVCVDIQDSEHVCTAVPQPTHQQPRQRTDTTLVGYATAHLTVRSYRVRQTFFSMCRAVCLEFTSRVCHRKRLIVCIQI